MNELEILKQIIDLEKSSSLLNINIQLWTDGDEKQKFISDKDSVDENINVLKVKIINIEDKQFSQKAKQGIINQMKAYIEKLKSDHPQKLLLKNQCTVLENELFSLLARDIKYQVEGHIFGIRIPSEFYYTISEKEGINVKNFISFLNNEIEILKCIDNLDFIILKNYYVDFECRLIENFNI